MAREAVFCRGMSREARQGRFGPMIPELSAVRFACTPACRSFRPEEGVSCVVRDVSAGGVGDGLQALCIGYVAE